MRVRIPTAEIDARQRGSAGDYVGFDVDENSFVGIRRVVVRYPAPRRCSNT